MATSGASSRRLVRKSVFVTMVVALVTAITASGALALPGETPASTLGTNGKVRALLQVGNVMWVGGQFSALSNGSSATNLAALDIDSGQAAGGVNAPDLGGSGSIVYDLTSDGNTVYAAGKFTASNGAKNLVAFNGTTGALIKSFNAPTLKSVLFDSGRILAGSAKLQAYLPSGSKDNSWTTTTAKIDVAIRGHNTIAAFRDLKPAPGSGYFAACECDWVLNPGDAQDVSSQTKAIVKLNANGSVDRSWTPVGLSSTSAAFGIDLFIDGNSVLLAAGGSDFTAKYDASNGNRLWLTDTNGSSQAVTRFDGNGSNYIVGGHYRCVENDFHPRLSALDLSGTLDPSWTVAPTPQYNGIWVVVEDTNNHLWIGGEFKKLGTGWTTGPCSDTHPVATGSVTQQSVARID